MKCLILSSQNVLEELVPENSEGLFRGTKRLFSVNICPVEGNSAGIFVSKLSPRGFEIKEKMKTYYFRENKTAIFGAIKAH